MTYLTIGFITASKFSFFSKTGNLKYVQAEGGGAAAAAS